MSKRFLIILAVLVLVFGGFLWFSKAKQNSKSTTSGSTNVSNHVQGAGTSGVTLVEYGDFQCPACDAYYPTIEQVRKQYGDQLKFQFRNFPLVQKHQNAMAAHRAAEAAAKQGKFWEMYNALYSQQKSWESSSDPTKIFEDYAMQLALNVDQFKRDYTSASVNDTINADLKEGQRLGVDATPTFFINGKKVEPTPDNTVEAFTKLIDQAATKQQ
jgi:protein-disulfide isomerase